MEDCFIAKLLNCCATNFCHPACPARERLAKDLFLFPYSEH
jgi:hypothetical protein